MLSTSDDSAHSYTPNLIGEAFGLSLLIMMLGMYCLGFAVVVVAAAVVDVLFQEEKIPFYS